ncbi:hypothetical protein G7Y89_g1385 [Cudoniella acicularis]|uniref:AB hydrolase-1 domain-containing protein n=1 Tax=Cudoniella acicularis TaxID=354080 RepID=A0A8H4RXD2_9HELO|nr:hypothetical protein G7Y89_g1385 [Cudoniella acicularis]
MPFMPIGPKSSPRNVFYTDDAQTGTGPSLTTVFIHGLGSSSCFYKPIVPALLAFTRCIALDTSGSGLSKLTSSAEAIHKIAEDVICLIEELKIQGTVTLVGHSMGGIVASYIAANYRNITASVVLLGPVQPTLALAEVFTKRIETVKNDGLEALANTIPTAATGSKSSSLHHAFIRSLILSTPQRGYTALCKAISNADPPNYPRIKVPLLLIAGAEDKTSPLESSKAILNAYGTSAEWKRIEVLEGVGHWHCIEAPEEVDFVRVLENPQSSYPEISTLPRSSNFLEFSTISQSVILNQLHPHLTAECTHLLNSQSIKQHKPGNIILMLIPLVPTIRLLKRHFLSASRALETVGSTCAATVSCRLVSFFHLISGASASLLGGHFASYTTDHRLKKEPRPFHGWSVVSI